MNFHRDNQWLIKRRSLSFGSYYYLTLTSEFYVDLSQKRATVDLNS